MYEFEVGPAAPNSPVSRAVSPVPPNVPRPSEVSPRPLGHPLNLAPCPHVGNEELTSREPEATRG